ncbi:hypothetical protein EDB86DRAFT_2825485 [Lactarius hatsudake]|nr:hypothetical protein EDB86DRAFT_2825485 [Lactarius hatsudake]
MSLNPLKILKRGFAEFLGKIKERKDTLIKKLSRVKPFPHPMSGGCHWLDHEGNTIDEECILEVLQSAPDYERAVSELDNDRKAIVRKLREWAGASDKAQIKRRQELKKKLTQSAPVFMKKENVTLAQWIEILDWHLAGSQPKLALLKLDWAGLRRWPGRAQGSGFKFGRLLSQPMAQASIFRAIHL